jgi:hypothetical protein
VVLESYRAQASLAAYTWSATIICRHSDRRNGHHPVAHRAHAASQAFARAAIYSNDPLSTGNPILAVHIQESRNYVK